MPVFSDYIVFADESGDHGLDAVRNEYPVFVLAFAIVHKVAYVEKIVPALQAMKLEFFGHDQVVLHERDIRRQLPPFGFLRTDSEIRQRFLDRLNEVVAAADVQLIASVVHKDRLKARYAEPWNPYEIALLFCMEQTCARLKYLGQEGRRVHVIFESRGAVEDKSLELEFRRIAGNDGGWGWKKTDFSVCEWEPIMVPKAANSSGLQLADLVARPIGLSALRPGQPNRAYDIIKPKIWTQKAFPR